MKQTRLIVDEKTIKEFIEHIAANGVAPHTQKRYEHDVKMFADFLGERKISPKILNEYKAAKLEEYSAATVKTILFGLNKYLAFIGCDLRINNKDLIAHRAKTPDELLTMDEYLQVLSAVKSHQDDRLYVIVETICSAGLKYSELKYLTVEAIEAGLLVLPYGVRKNRNVYLPKNLCADLRKFCADNGVYRGSVFLTKRGNFPDRGNMTGVIREACKNTGIDQKKLSMRAFKDFYTANFENIRSEMAELIDEDLRILHTPSFAASNENSFRSFALKWLNDSENGLTDIILINIASDKKNPIKGSIRFNYMFPVLEEYVEKVTIKNISDVKQRRLMLKEYNFCVDNEQNIRTMAMKTYIDVICKRDTNLTENSCDFHLLENALNESPTITAGDSR